jgi:hypothetical protein
MIVRPSLALRVTALSLITSLLAACAAPVAPRAAEAPAAPPMPAMSDGMAYEAEVGRSAMPAPAATAAPAAGQSQPGQPRLIIRTADMTLIVTDTLTQLDAISKIAGSRGGFIVSSSTSRYEDEMQGQVTLRVDAAQFDQALSDIRTLAVEVRNESMRGEDVTAEFVDLDAQLKNLEAAEAQLQQILKQATKTEDVLNVYRELTAIRGQIEQIKGRMKYLSQSAALATISVSLIPDALAQPVDVGGWQPAGVAKNAVEALIASLQGLVSVGIWLVIAVAPLLLIVAIPFVILFAFIRRSRRNRPAVRQSPAGGS